MAASKGGDIKSTISMDGEREYKATAKEINSTLRLIGSEMKVVTAEFAGNEKSTEALTRKQEVLQKTLDEQTKKVKAAEEALQRFKDAGEEGSQGAIKMETALNNAKAEMIKTQNELDTTGHELQNAGKEADSFSDEIRSAASETEAAGGKFSKLGEIAGTVAKGFAIGLAAMGTAAAAAAAGIWKLGNDAGKTADDLITLSNKTSIGVETLQEWGYAARFVDVEVDTITGAMPKLVKAMDAASQGSKKQVEAFNELKVEYQNSDGTLRDKNEVFLDLVDALGQVTNETKRDALAMQVLGKSAMEMNPLIKAGSDELRQLGQEAREAGIILSEETVGKLGEFDDTMQRTQAQFKGLGQQIAVAFLPVLQKFGDGVLQSTKALTESLGSAKIQASIEKLGREFEKVAQSALDMAVKAIPKVVDGITWLIDNGKTLAGVLGGVVTAFYAFKAIQQVSGFISTLSTAITAFAATTAVSTTAVGTATVAQTGWNVALSANPIGVVVMAIAALTAGIVAYALIVGGAKSKTAELTETTKELLSASNEHLAAVEAGKQAHEDALAGIEAEARANERLADKVIELAAKENKTTGEKAKLKGMIDQLNRSMPELNLAYDEQLDILNKTNPEIKTLINNKKELAKVRAAEEEAVRINREIIAAEQQIAANETQITEIKKQLTAVQEKQAEAADKVTGSYYGGIDASTKYMLEAQNLQGQIQALTDTNTALGASMVKQEADLDSLFEKTVTTNEGIAASSQETTDQLEEDAKRQEELNKKIEQAYDSYAGVAENAFDRVKEGSKLSVKEMIANLEHNQKAVEIWSNGLDTLAKRGLDDGLIKKLREAGPESKKQVEALVKASDKEIQKLNDAFQKGSEVATQAVEKEFTRDEFVNSGADAVDKIATGITDNKGAEQASKTAIEEAIAAAKAAVTAGNPKSIGEQISNGIANGIRSGQSKIVNAAADVVKAAIRSAKDAGDIKSPSRKTRDEVGLNLGLGVGLGFLDSINTVSKQVRGAIGGIIGDIQDATNDAMPKPKPVGGGRGFGGGIGGVVGGGGIVVNQTIYANETSYFEQQRQARKNMQLALGGATA